MDGDNSLFNIELKWLVEEFTRGNVRGCSELPFERRIGLWNKKIKYKSLIIKYYEIQTWEVWNDGIVNAFEL